MHRLAALLARRPQVVLALLALASLAALAGLAQLRFDNDPRNLFKVRDAAYDEMERVAVRFGADDGACVIVVEADDVFAPSVLAQVRKLVDAARGIAGVHSVQSVLDAKRPGPGRLQLALVPKPGSPAEAFTKAKQRALRHPLLAGQLLASDARTTLVVVQLVGAQPEFARINRVVNQLKGIMRQHAQPGVRLRLTGVPAIRAEIARMVQRDLVKFNLLGTALSVGIALYTFRRPAAVALLCVAPMLGSLWTLGAMGWFGVTINVINGVVPTLVLVIGHTDSMHFLVDIQRSRSAGQSRRQAALNAVAHVGAASGLTSLTTAVGFASLAVARVQIIRDFGLVCAAGSVITFLAVVLALPLFAAGPLGDRLFPETALADERRSRWSAAVVQWSMRRHVGLAMVGVAAAIVLALIAVRLTPNTWVAENVPRGSESGEALAHCDRVLGGLSFLHAVIDYPAGAALDSQATLQTLVDVQHAMAAEPPARHCISLLNVLASLPDATRGLAQAAQYLPRVPDDLRRRFLDAEERRLLVTARIPDCGAILMQPALDRLQARLAAVEAAHPGFRIRLTGSQVMACRNVPKMIGDLGSSVGLESAIIFAMMTWSFRSWRLGLISVLPNVFPLICVAALIVSLGWPLQIGSVIVFNICLGLAVDDTIHVMTRFRRELEQTHDVDEAVRRGFQAVGPAMLTTTAILLAGFVAVMMSRVPALQLFGGLACVTILTAMVAELLLLPALLTTFLRWRERAAGGSTAAPAAPP